MNNPIHNPIFHGARITAVASAFLVLGTLAPGAVADAMTSQESVVSSGMLLAATEGMDRRQDRRDDRQDCRQDEGLVGGDKRDCKQEGRADDSGDETSEPEETDKPDETDKPEPTEEG